MDLPPDDTELDDVDNAELDELLYDAVLPVPDGLEEPEVDGQEGGSVEPQTALPSKVESWRRRSATGAILTGFALGLQEVFEPKRDEPAIMIQTSGDPPQDLPIDADFEYQRPRQSVVSIRPWLIDDQPPADLEPDTGLEPDAGPAGDQQGAGHEPADPTAGKTTDATPPTDSTSSP